MFRCSCIHTIVFCIYISFYCLGYTPVSSITFPLYIHYIYGIWAELRRRAA